MLLGDFNARVGRYEESVWMKVRGERGRSALYIGCVYMSTDS